MTASAVLRPDPGWPSTRDDRRGEAHLGELVTAHPGKCPLPPPGKAQRLRVADAGGERIDPEGPPTRGGGRRSGQLPQRAGLGGAVGGVPHVGDLDGVARGHPEGSAREDLGGEAAGRETGDAVVEAVGHP
jgi:hypothetical protein